MEAQLKQVGYDIFSSSFSNIEIANDRERAIVIIPLMHVGANKKGLFWTASMLKKIAPMFRSVPFRYDLEGREGSSHTLNKLSSPHYDVGWTYSSEEGAWYDEKTKALWVKGEVTHPEVIAKLARQTSDGKREVNFASMGVIVEDAKCSICGAEFLDGACENGHERNKKYDGKTCYKVPTKISKVLHAALTNDPADGEAEIKNVLFQELGYEAAPEDKRKQAGEQMERNDVSNQIPGGLAPSSPQTAQPGEAPSSEQILKDLAERIKTIEQKISTQAMQEGTPEVVNVSPQDQFTQSNMGTTTEFEETKQSEENKMDAKDAQYSNEKAPVNPEKKEVADMGSVMEMLKQILAKLSATESADMGKESLSAGKGMASKSQEDIPTEHQGPGEAVRDSTEPGNAKNKKAMMKPEKVENADDEEVNSMKKEFADLQKIVKELRSKLEIQDNNDLPEFGGSSNVSGSVDVADMGARQRTEKFGEYGAWDAIFNGTQSAAKFKR